MPFLKWFPLGTPYPEIVTFVMALLQTDELKGATLVIDRTGVGRAVGELFCDAILHSVNCWYTLVLITSGHTVIESNGFCQIPKTELVSCLQVLLQTSRPDCH
jgi:hypothetical protein